MTADTEKNKERRDSWERKPSAPVTEIKTQNAPEAAGPYSQAATWNEVIFCSGQIPLSPKTGEIISADIKKQTEQCLRNLEAVLAAADSSLKCVLKTTVYITDMKYFPLVNEVYARYFSEPYPARACIQAGALPKGAQVEMEAVAVKNCSGKTARQ